MATPAVYKINAEITPLQERLLDFFDSTDAEFAHRLSSLEWVFEDSLFNRNTELDQDGRMHLFDLSEVIKILKGIGQGY